MLDELSRSVSETSLMDDMRVFAERTKLSGTPTEMESFRYLQRRMDELGFRTNLIEHDALISLPGPCTVAVGNAALPAITHSFSRPGSIRAKLVEGGEGTEADLAGKDLSGAILLVEGIASPAVAARASAAGAAGHLHISPTEHRYEMCISPVWGSPAPNAVANLPTTIAATINNQDGMALRARLAAGEALDAAIEAQVDTGWRKTPLLVADLDGPNSDSPFILLSGHHDTWYEGVMDNGGANAAMIEVARICAARHADWRRSLRLCFWSGHSHGRYSGSTWYVDQNWDDLDRNCAAHVNLDSCGGIGATDLAGSAVSAELAALAATAVAAESGQTHKGHRVGRNSDQSFFGIGIPAMFGSISHQPHDPNAAKMRNALGWWWHTPHDLLDKIDPAFLVRDTRIALRAVWSLLTEPVLPIDLAAQADSLLSHLQPIATTVPLEPALRGLETLRSQAQSIPRDAVGAEADRVNAALMRACRALIPLDYTTGDRFSHDPALPLPPYPALAPIAALAQCRPDTDTYRHAAVAAARARNRLLHALREAQLALSSI